MKFASALELKLIYVFRINDEAHRGCLKVGETTCDDRNALHLPPNSRVLNEAAKKRINQYTQTAGIAYDLLYTEIAAYDNHGIHMFGDTDVHDVLKRSGIQKKIFDTVKKANEWFITDLETVKRAIAAVKEGRKSLLPGEVTQNQSPIIFRPEQEDAIRRTKAQFIKGNQMLWNAKMRFGKTLSALQVVKELNFKRTLILTHRPVVNASWFEDFGKIFYDRPDFAYGSKDRGDPFVQLETRTKSQGSHYVYFASMQDLRGSEAVGGNFDKNNELFDTPWDSLIIDEAHEGTQTDLGKNVLSQIIKRKTKVLRLSGTPFNLLEDFKDDEIYTWDYVMEQRAKMEWDSIHFGDPNPYAALPTMNIYTYDLGRLLNLVTDDIVAFNFREFFRVNESGQFVRENDVKAFLNLLTKEDNESCYPFANDEYRDIFRHTLWIVPGVKEAKALSALLQSHPVFQHFKIINVAGNGDEDEARSDALDAVKLAIGDNPDETRTITLSCGRLTTGVSVPAWTGVLMLSGSYQTSALSYMQTIFRVQTPAKINGRIKVQCYVFDFAPDRALKVIAETAKISEKAGKTSQNDRRILGEFLNFCPVIAIEGSTMSRFDATHMLQQLKRIAIDRVVRNGFEDNRLYSDELLKMDDLELQEFDNLKKIIGQTKSMPKTDQVDINKQGLTNEEYEEKRKLEKKPKRELSEEEQKRLEELKKKNKNREAAISILRGISIRMPLLIYGAELTDEEQEITIDNFTSLIDPQSWDEFMPKGVTKQRFNSFKKYYDPEVFCAAGKRIRAMARAADSLSVEQRIERITRIFDTFRNPDKETVLTPWRVVNMHLGDTLGGYNFFDTNYEERLTEPRFIDHGKVTAEVFTPDARILEINSKSGLYPLYMAYSIYRVRLKESLFAVETVEEQQAVWDKVIAENIFVICKTKMASSITRRTLAGFRPAAVRTHAFDDLINQIKNKPQSFIERISRGQSFWNAINDNHMKFNAIVGNPPYQVMDGGTDRGAVPVYQYFMNIAKKLHPNYISMIMPARWYAGGRGLDDFRADMLSDTHLSILHDFELSKDLFPSVDIAGGLCTFLWDSHHSGVCTITNHNALKDVIAKRYLNQFGILIRSNAAVPILEKVTIKSVSYLNSLVLSINPFGFRTYFRGSNKGDIKILTSKGWAKVYRSEVTKGIEYIDSYKIIVGRFVPSNGEMSVKPGDGYRVLTEPQILGPSVINTETYIDTAVFPTLEQATNYKKYLYSKFTRFLLRQGVTSVNVTKECFAFVPLQDFTENSDIQWNKSIPEIDQQLYAKYHLTNEEIAFIEKMIKPME